MSSSFSRPSLDDLLSRSILGTALVLLGGAIILAGTLYGVALGLTELLSPPASGPTPAGNGTAFGPVAVVLLLGSTVVALGGQLVGYSR